METNKEIRTKTHIQAAINGGISFEDLRKAFEAVCDRLEQAEKDLEKPPEDILVCKCGWWGTVEQQDALGSKCGCCPDCGNEKLVWVSELQKRLEQAAKQIESMAGQLDQSTEDLEEKQEKIEQQQNCIKELLSPAKEFYEQIDINLSDLYSDKDVRKAEQAIAKAEELIKPEVEPENGK